MLFKNNEPKVENDCSSNFDPHVVRVGAHGVSPSKLIAKKKKGSATTWCLPIKSLPLLLFVHRKTN